MEKTTIFYLLCFLNYLIFVLFIVARIIKKKFDLADPGLIINFTYLLHFPIRLWQIELTGSDILGIPAGNVVSDDILKGMYIGTLGILLFNFGYQIYWKSKPIFLFPLKDSLLGYFSLYAVGWILRGITSFIQYGSIWGFITTRNKDFALREVAGVTYLSTLSYVCISFLIGFLIVRLRIYQEKKYWLLFCVLLFVESIYAILSGSRASLVVLFFIILLGFYMTASYRRKFVNLRYLTLVLSLILIGILLYIPLTILRFEGVESLGMGIEYVFDVGRIGGLNAICSLVSARLHGLDSVTLIAQYVPAQADYSHFKELLRIFFAWIPRVVWPAKPIISLGKMFRDEYLMNVFGANTSVAMTAVGHLYFGFGWVSVGLGMFLFGFLFRWFYESVVAVRNSDASFLFSFLTFNIFIGFFEQDLTSFFTQSVFQLFIVWFLVGWFSDKNRFSLKL